MIDNMSTKEELLGQRDDIRKKILHLEWDLKHNQAGFKNQVWLEEQKKNLKDIEEKLVEEDKPEDKKEDEKKDAEEDKSIQ